MAEAVWADPRPSEQKPSVQKPSRTSATQQDLKIQVAKKSVPIIRNTGGSTGAKKFCNSIQRTTMHYQGIRSRGAIFGMSASNGSNSLRRSPLQILRFLILVKLPGLQPKPERPRVTAASRAAVGMQSTIKEAQI